MVDHLRFTQDSSGGAGASPRLAATPCGYFTFTKPTGRVTGNRGAIVVSGGALHGFSACAPIVIPASGVVVFARDEQYRNLLTGSCRAAFFNDGTILDLDGKRSSRHACRHGLRDHEVARGLSNFKSRRCESCREEAQETGRENREESRQMALASSRNLRHGSENHVTFFRSLRRFGRVSGRVSYRRLTNSVPFRVICALVT